MLKPRSKLVSIKVKSGPTYMKQRIVSAPLILFTRELMHPSIMGHAQVVT